MFKVIEIYRDGEQTEWGKKFNMKHSAEKAIMDDIDMNFDNCSDMIEKYRIVNENGKTIKIIYCD